MPPFSEKEQLHNISAACLNSIPPRNKLYHPGTNYIAQEQTIPPRNKLYSPGTRGTNGESHLPAPELLFAVRGQRYHGKVPPASVDAVPVSRRVPGEKDGAVGLHLYLTQSILSRSAVLRTRAHAEKQKIAWSPNNVDRKSSRIIVKTKQEKHDEPAEARVYVIA